MDNPAALQLLKAHKIRPTYQRMRILNVLRASSDHPTAETLYLRLKTEIPALSRSTVYNTLLTLAEAGLARVIHIDENSARFDGITEEHGHFVCLRCGKIENIAIDMDHLTQGQLAGCRLLERHVSIRGLCRQCLAGTSMSEEDSR